MANLVIDAVPQDQSGVASAVNTIARSIGGAVGGQIAATLLVAHKLADGTPKESGYTEAFTVSFVAGVLTLGVCLLVPRPGGGGPPVRSVLRNARRAPAV
jgi:hypothetical protein